eukprot:COSAG01_NODE_414_length_17360_cov_226.576907_10_plen_102_part_00
MFPRQRPLTDVSYRCFTHPPCRPIAAVFYTRHPTCGQRWGQWRRGRMKVAARPRAATVGKSSSPLGDHPQDVAARGPRVGPTVEVNEVVASCCGSCGRRAP